MRCGRPAVACPGPAARGVAGPAARWARGASGVPRAPQAAAQGRCGVGGPVASLGRGCGAPRAGAAGCSGTERSVVPPPARITAPMSGTCASARHGSRPASARQRGRQTGRAPGRPAAGRRMPPDGPQERPSAPEPPTPPTPGFRLPTHPGRGARQGAGAARSKRGRAEGSRGRRCLTGRRPEACAPVPLRKAGAHPGRYRHRCGGRAGFRAAASGPTGFGVAACGAAGSRAAGFGAAGFRAAEPPCS